MCVGCFFFPFKRVFQWRTICSHCGHLVLFVCTISSLRGNSRQIFHVTHLLHSDSRGCDWGVDLKKQSNVTQVLPSGRLSHLWVTHRVCVLLEWEKKSVLARSPASFSRCCDWNNSIYSGRESQQLPTGRQTHTHTQHSSDCLGILWKVQYVVYLKRKQHHRVELGRGFKETFYGARCVCCCTGKDRSQYLSSYSGQGVMQGYYWQWQMCQLLFSWRKKR